MQGVNLFLGISNAFSVLNDKQKRAHYDRYGEEMEPTVRRQQRYYHEDEFEGLLLLFWGVYLLRVLWIQKSNERKHDWV